MITAAALREYTTKDLAQMARKKGVSGWHRMRKDELVSALVRIARRKANSKRKPTVAEKSRSSASRSGKTSLRTSTSRHAANNGRKKPNKSKSAAVKAKGRRASRRIQQVNAQRGQLKDLAGPSENGKLRSKRVVDKDRAVLMVRDPYWLHVYWEISRRSVQRVQAALAEQWHTARPVLRLLEVDRGNTTSTTERVVRDIPIHGGVNNWYVDVQDPPKSYRVCIGYLGSNGKFHSLVRSNAVKTPLPGSSDAIDENWSAVAENYEKVYALSGGYVDDGTNSDLQELFEERLRRPMGSPIVTRYGVGAEGTLYRDRKFLFDVDAEMIIYGATKPDAHVTLAGEPVKLRQDGTFTVRLSMPDKRQVLPVVASSADGVEQRTTVLAVERNTKVMEPMIRDPNE